MPSSEENFPEVKLRPQIPPIDKREIGDATILGDVSVGRHVRICDGAVRHKVVKEGWGDDRTLWNPRSHLAGR